VIGALIIEQIESELPRNLVAPRMDLVYEHSARALTNSMDHSNLFLMPLWRTLGKAAWVVRARTLPKTLTIAGLVLLALCILTFVKKDFYLKSKGSLEPAIKRDVFVAVPGIVNKVHVEDQQTVQAGDPLVTLENTDLEVQLQEVLGQLQSTYEQLLAAIDAKSSRGSTNLSEDEKVRLGGQIRELRARIQSLELQRDLLLKKNELLKITAPISGQVMLSWDVEESLMNRTVEPGQVLMTIADPSGEWELDLYMKETRAGKVDLARHDIQPDLAVKYVLATDPGNERDGTVVDVEDITQMHDEEGHTVRIRVGISQSDITDPRPGTTVRGKVLCGRAAIGYTWFHEAIEWVQANVLF
jgi:multidrug efflux pump subunit AcrA (membrane-fusion protein)